MKTILSFLLLSLPVLPQVSSVIVTNKQLFVSNAGWDSWGLNNVISYTTNASGIFEAHTINPDGSGDSCFTCGMVGLPANVSRGAMSFSPDGKWVIFQCQKAGSTNTTLPPGNGTDYDIYISDYPQVSGPWKVSGATTATLWPEWNTQTSRYSYTQWYQAADSSHPAGYWQVVTQSFNPASPSTISVIGSPCTFGTVLGLYEPGQYFDDHNIWVMNQQGTSAGQLRNYIGYKLDTNTCTATQWIKDDSSWTEFGRLPFVGRRSPYTFFTTSKTYPNSTVLNLTTDEFYQDNRGYLTTGDTSQQLTYCNWAGDPMYNSTYNQFCAIHGFSPDGTKAMIQVQQSTGLGSLDPRQIWILTLKMNGRMRGGAKLRSGAKIR